MLTNKINTAETHQVIVVVLHFMFKYYIFPFIAHTDTILLLREDKDPFP